MAGEILGGRDRSQTCARICARDANAGAGSTATKFGLTPRDSRLFRPCGGFANKEIAEHFKISEDT